jgi:hypothetical protein
MENHRFTALLGKHSHEGNIQIDYHHGLPDSRDGQQLLFVADRQKIPCGLR